MFIPITLGLATILLVIVWDMLQMQRTVAKLANEVSSLRREACLHAPRPFGRRLNPPVGTTEQEAGDITTNA